MASDQHEGRHGITGLEPDTVPVCGQMSAEHLQENRGRQYIHIYEAAGLHELSKTM